MNGFRLCIQCGKPIPPHLIAKTKKIKTAAKFCSRVCRDNNVSADSLKEPLNAKEEAELDKLIEEGKARIRGMIDKVPASNIPKDDSPETERNLRKQIELTNGYSEHWKGLENEYIEDKYLKAIEVSTKGIE